MEFFEMSWKRMNKLGFTIQSGHDSKLFWEPHQKLYYTLVRKKKDIIWLGYDAFRSAKSRGTISIEHDPLKKRIRLRGKMVLAAPDLPVYAGVSEWVYYGMDNFF